MTKAPSASAPRAHSHMAPTADPQPSTPTPAGPAAAAAAAPEAASSRWAKLTENPLLTVLGTATVALLIFTLTRTDNRIARLENNMDAGFAAVDERFAEQAAKIDAGFAAVDERFAEQDAKIDAINLKLTALIAALNTTDEVDAALEGRLLDQDAPRPMTRRFSR